MVEFDIKAIKRSWIFFDSFAIGIDIDIARHTWLNLYIALRVRFTNYFLLRLQASAYLFFLRQRIYVLYKCY